MNFCNKRMPYVEKKMVLSYFHDANNGAVIYH